MAILALIYLAHIFPNGEPLSPMAFAGRARFASPGLERATLSLSPDPAHSRSALGSGGLCVRRGISLAHQPRKHASQDCTQSLGSIRPFGVGLRRAGWSMTSAPPG